MIRSAVGKGLKFANPKVAPGQDSVEITRRFKKCFQGPDGKFVLEHLRKTFIETREAPIDYTTVNGLVCGVMDQRFRDGQANIVEQIIAEVEKNVPEPQSD